MQKNIQYINIRIFIIHPLLVRIHISDAEVVFLQQVKVVTDEVKQVLSLRIPLRESEGEWGREREQHTQFLQCRHWLLKATLYGEFSF